VISDDKIAEIRQAARISEFISPHVALKRRGRSLLGLCPFHNEKSPSFSVDDDRGFYHCFGCSAGGNVFTFLMEHERLTFPEAVRKVASHYGIDVPETDANTERRDPSFYEINASAARYYRRFLVETEHGRRFRDYLASRGIGEEVAETFTVGAASPSGTGLARWLAKEGVDLRKAAALGLVVDRGGTAYDRFRDRLMFPIRDSQGRVIGFGGRQMGDGDGPKYLNSPESEVYQKSRALYGIYEARDALRHAETVLLVEGYVDVIALHQAGVPNTVATCGTAFTATQLRMIRRHAAEVVTFFDGDAAGRRAAARSLPVFVEESLWPKGVSLPEGEDPDTFVRNAGVDALRDKVRAAVPLATVYAEQIQATAGRDSASVARLGTELAGILALVKNEFERDFLLKKVAFAAGLSEEVLRREASKDALGVRSLATGVHRALSASDGAVHPVPTNWW
jgi:DNA primase